MEYLYVFSADSNNVSSGHIIRDCTIYKKTSRSSHGFALKYNNTNIRFINCTTYSSNFELNRKDCGGNKILSWIFGWKPT